MKIDVYDPVMCCSTGVCGADVDPELVRFAALVEKLKQQGVKVQRYNLAHEPLAFAQNEVIRDALAGDNKCLPIVLVDGEIISKGGYVADDALLSMIERGRSDAV